MRLIERLQERFGIGEVTPDTLDRFTGRNMDRENQLVETILESNPSELEEAGILLWTDNRTFFSDQHEKLDPRLKVHFGENYESYLAARRILYATDIFRPLDSLQKLFLFLKGQNLAIGSGEEFATQFGTCSDLSEVFKKLEIHKRLTQNRLSQFYRNERVPLFDFKEYTITASRGFYEHQGGFCLSLNDKMGELVYVSGWLHQSTRVVSIHGASPPQEGSKEVSERMDGFREKRGIHPANLALLMYLKLGEKLEHEQVRIRGSASPIHNQERKDSPFYQIPRNYFRLRANPKNGYYEMDGVTRDTLLAKFARKSGIVNDVFQEINEYVT